MAELTMSANRLNWNGARGVSHNGLNGKGKAVKEGAHVLVDGEIMEMAQSFKAIAFNFSL